MKILHLTLKKKWFDMTKTKIKREDYREIKPYWVQRLTDLPNFLYNITPEHMLSEIEFCRKDFTHVKARNGYAKDAPQLLEEVDEITVATGKYEWGAEPGKLYFVIRYKD